MRLFTHTIWIGRPREATFDFFLDFAQAPRWRQYVRTMTVIGSGPIAPGSRVHVTMDLGGEDYVFDLEVLACDRPSRWRHRTNETDYIGMVEYRFDPERDGTRVTMRFDVTPIGWYGWLGLPLLMLRRGKSFRAQLPSLKRALEA